MRFLTKDWYLRYIQVEWIKTLRVVANAKFFSEQRYQWAYEQKEKQFIKHSKYDPLSVNHQSILKKVEKIIAPRHPPCALIRLIYVLDLCYKAFDRFSSLPWCL